ncbi:MAG: PHB depolymerase family esterase [Leptothrix sp. (in: b-proteobacteria)]
MARRKRTAGWAGHFGRSWAAIARMASATGQRALARSLKPVLASHKPPPGAGEWILGIAIGTTGVRRFRLYRPPGIGVGERLPLMLMLHRCGPDANGFAASARLNRIAMRERFLVLYPERGRLANLQGCWNWFDTRNGRGAGRGGADQASDRPGLPAAAGRPGAGGGGRACRPGRAWPRGW